jgi:hypothetical protein
MSENQESVSPIESDPRLAEAVRSTVEQIVGSGEMSTEEKDRHFTEGILRGVRNGFIPSILLGAMVHQSFPSENPTVRILAGGATTFGSMSLSAVSGGLAGLSQGKEARSTFAREIRVRINKLFPSKE